MLERSLEQKRPRAEIINLGVSGWETPEEYHLLKMYGIKLKPDVVMLSFFRGE